MGTRRAKAFRQKELSAHVTQHPFATDEDLAREFRVSIPTIRLDRLELGIPEMRERIRDAAGRNLNDIRSMGNHEIVGELIEFSLGDYAISLLVPDDTMAFARTRIVRGHMLFAQANSLAVAIIDAETALTGTARVRFVRPVHVGEHVVARAEIKMHKGRKYLVRVQSLVNGEPIFVGHFVVFQVVDDSLVDDMAE